MTPLEMTPLEMKHGDKRTDKQANRQRWMAAQGQEDRLMVEHFSEAAGGGATVMQLGGSSGRRLR